MCFSELTFTIFGSSLTFQGLLIQKHMNFVCRQIFDCNLRIQSSKPIILDERNSSKVFFNGRDHHLCRNSMLWKYIHQNFKTWKFLSVAMWINWEPLCRLHSRSIKSKTTMATKRSKQLASNGHSHNYIDRMIVTMLQLNNRQNQEELIVQKFPGFPDL